MAGFRRTLARFEIDPRGDFSKRGSGVGREQRAVVAAARIVEGGGRAGGVVGEVGEEFGVGAWGDGAECWVSRYTLVTLHP